MGMQQALQTIRKYHKTIFHLTMLTSLVAVTSNIASVSAAESPIIDKQQQQPPPPAAIPYCDERHDRTIGRRLLYITTLDGRLSALDMTKNGKLRWSVTTGPGPLISSSIHRLELTNNGKFVRMIPSLSGGIYKFDGESIDPIPVTAENLLSSSAKFSEDLVISGGKDARTYGVSARTGQVLYESSMNGSVNSTNDEKQRNTTTAPEAVTAGSNNDTEEEDVEVEEEEDAQKIVMKPHDDLVDDVIVLRRQTQTVRAIETRSGSERWNFSVGQHELYLSKPSDCHDHKLNDLDMAVLDIDIKVVVPEGIICAFSKLEPEVMLWKYKFDHPIVSAWKIGAKEDLENIDLFGSAQWLWNQDEQLFDMPLPTVSPSIYVGMYDRQLYIQESVHLRKEIMDQSQMYNQMEVSLPRIPWRPIAASSQALALIEDDKTIGGGGHNKRDTSISGYELVPYDEDNFAISAQSVLNASEYVNGNGFYLYTSEVLAMEEEKALCDDKDKPPEANESETETLNTTNHTIDDDLGFSLDDIDAPVKVVILSLWFWWKEIVVIAFTSAILMNFLLGQRQHTEREIVVIERHIPVPTGIEATEASTQALLGPVSTPPSQTNGSKSTSNGFMHPQRSVSESTSHSGDNFQSRFQSDFDLMQCLGRGGFGVVFEVKNKLDDCKYAIKRITLPNKEESRRRVLREAKTLASCEHQNIVRYFHSWVETPPPGWQEQEDSKWLAHEMSTSIQIETPDGTTLPSLASGLAAKQNGGFQVDKKKQMLSWISSVATSTACSWDHDGGANGDCKFNHDDDDESDGIIFRSESQSMALRESEYSADDSKENRTSAEAAISIDIHSNSFDMSLNRQRKPIDYSQLSDSFQIEFVRSANGEEHGDDEDEEHDDDAKNGVEIIDISNNATNNRKRRPNALEIKNNNNHLGNNNQSGTPPSAKASATSNGHAKLNKVYLYIQMQLCRKESLRDWLRDNRLDARLQHVASIFHQIVDAVDYVHLKGLIHRDLKPSNIFFSQDGQIKIGDFGLVTDMSDIPNMVTQCGDSTGLPSCARHTQQVGTHLYMSPEQLRGKHYDYKVDIYSLGLIFFELHVYFGTEMERIKTMRDLRDGHYPKQFCEDHPAEHRLLERMLATNPEERPQTKELKQELNKILQLPDLSDDGDSVGGASAAALAEAARRLSRSRTFSRSE